MGILNAWNDFAHCVKPHEEHNAKREEDSRLYNIFYQHYHDADGNPEGGVTYGHGFTISWQRGPLGRVGTDERQQPNGAFVEDVIAAVRTRLEFYQAGKFACDENAEALKHLNRALVELHKRTLRRTESQTEGTHEGN